MMEYSQGKQTDFAGSELTGQGRHLPSANNMYLPRQSCNLASPWLMSLPTMASPTLSPDSSSQEALSAPTCSPTSDSENLSPDELELLAKLEEQNR